MKENLAVGGARFQGNRRAEILDPTYGKSERSLLPPSTSVDEKTIAPRKERIEDLDWAIVPPRKVRPQAGRVLGKGTWEHWSSRGSIRARMG
jgi:hypothetical protein